jgi:hypothetical protein
LFFPSCEALGGSAARYCASASRPQGNIFHATFFSLARTRRLFVFLFIFAALTRLLLLRYLKFFPLSALHSQLSREEKTD